MAITIQLVELRRGAFVGRVDVLPDDDDANVLHGQVRLDLDSLVEVLAEPVLQDGDGIAMLGALFGSFQPGRLKVVPVSSSSKMRSLRRPYLSNS